MAVTNDVGTDRDGSSTELTEATFFGIDTDTVAGRESFSGAEVCTRTVGGLRSKRPVPID